MNKQKSIAILKAIIKAKREQVIKILFSAGILLPINPSDEFLLDICMREIEINNPLITLKLATLIDSFFSETEQKSSIVGTLISVGTSIIGNLMGSGGGDDGKAMAAAQLQASRDAAAAQAALQRQLTIAASNAEADRLRYEASTKKRKSATTRTVLTISIIGTTLIIAGIITFVALRNKPKTNN